MRYGIIGTGNMGSMLTTSFITSKAVSARDLVIYNRSAEKALKLKKIYKNLTVASSLEEVTNNSDVIFLCVKPHHFKDVLDPLNHNLNDSHCLVSITSPVSVNELENHTPCQVARIVPSITNRALSGVSLFTFGERITEGNKQNLRTLFKTISHPVEIEEEYIRASSDIVSCGPAFVSFLLKNWIESAHKVSGIPQEKATELTEEMMIGLGTLLSKKIFSLDELMEKVTVKGGVTGEGLKALESHVGPLFEEMFTATQRKHLEDKKTIKF
ncbi:late competence protein ComER [Halobacillus rhizosphaerae]